MLLPGDCYDSGEFVVGARLHEKSQPCQTDFFTDMIIADTKSPPRAGLLNKSEISVNSFLCCVAELVI